MSLPVLNLIRGLPTDLRELGRVFGDLNFWIRRSTNRVFARDQRFLGQLSSGGKSSSQSVQPLTSTDSGGGFASISVASHTVQYKGFLVSFNSGTITGLPNNTRHFVYVTDPEFEGGAATYLATTNQQTPNADDNYYVGKIVTATAAGPPTDGGYGGGGGGNGNPLP